MRSTCTFNIACIATIFIGSASIFFSHNHHVESAIFISKKADSLQQLPLGLLFLLSPIFLCHKIQDCDYMNIINKKLHCIAHHKNTPALPATFHKESWFPDALLLHILDLAFVWVHRCYLKYFVMILQINYWGTQKGVILEPFFHFVIKLLS